GWRSNEHSARPSAAPPGRSDGAATQTPLVTSRTLKREVDREMAGRSHERGGTSVKGHQRPPPLLKSLLLVMPVLLVTKALAIDPYPCHGHSPIRAAGLA